CPPHRSSRWSQRAARRAANADRAMSTQAQPSTSARSEDPAPPAPRRARLGRLLRGTLSVAFLTAAGIGLFTALSGHGAEILDLLTRPGAQPYLAAALLCSVAGLVFLM